MKKRKMHGRRKAGRGTPPLPRVTAADLAHLQKLDLELGFDDDAEGRQQLLHVCYPYENNPNLGQPTGALCATDLLWFHIGAGPFSNPRALDAPACATCLELLRKR